MKEIAKILLKVGAVKLQPKEPFTYTSGLKSPIYIDNRFLISFPGERKVVVESILKLIREKNLDFDVVAGVATAGIHWAAWICDKLDKPMIYIRGKAKGHGRQNIIEGNLEKGKKVLVIEDHISTGGSSVDAVLAAREAGGIVSDCIAITTYEFDLAGEKFKECECNLYTLSGFKEIIETAVEMDYIKEDEKETVLEWNKDSEGWASKFGF